MGFSMHQREASFFVAREAQPLALAAFKEWARARDRISWVTIPDLLKARDLVAALEECGWRCDYAEAGDIIGIHFEREKLGDEDDIFAVLAPYVGEGSFIEMDGDDSDLWRWVFQGGTCRQVRPELRWPS